MPLQVNDPQAGYVEPILDEIDGREHDSETQAGIDARVAEVEAVEAHETAVEEERAEEETPAATKTTTSKATAEKTSA